MTERILGPTGSPRRKRWLGVPAALVIALGLLFVASAQAVHDEKFQLDGNALASVGATATLTVDWDSLFDSAGATKASLPTGFDHADLTKDFNTSQAGAFLTNDSTTYSTGSKDTLPISGWQCNLDNNVNSKIDVMNGYAATYESAAGDDILYFGIERNANTGTADVGFWFLQDAVGCTSTGPSVTFTGEHKDGDLLIVSEFTGGGTVSTINAYRWDRFTGDCDATPVNCVRNPAGVPGSLNPTPVAAGVDCRANTTPPGDTTCGAANTAAISTPWLTAAKTLNPNVGHSLPTAQFFEGGVNLTKANLGGKCFSTFLADTRSSTSLTATLFDFTGGTIGSCETTLTTTAANNGQTTTIDSTDTAANGTASSGTDNATLTVTGVEQWAGSLNFYLCGPMPAVSDLCNANGVLVSTVAVDETTVNPITSGSKTLTSAGRYCWFAEFTPDADTAAAGVSGKTHAGTAGENNLECFVVSPATPTLSTDAGTSPVDLGQAVTDEATLTGVAKEPGSNGATNGGDADWPSINATNGAYVGTIGFTLKGPDNPTATPAVCSTTNATAFTGETTTFPINKTVTGNGTYTGVSFIPGAPGQYHWVAVYSHTAATTNNSGLPVTHNANCSNTDEDVIVRQIPTSISTAQKVFPQDSATLTSSISGNALPAGGTVIFRLYQATAGGNTALQNCQAHGSTVGSGGLIYTRSFTTAGGTSETLTTDNTTVSVNASGTYYWYVTYAPGDTAHTGRQSNCSESTALTFTNDSGPGTVFP
jgi:hypothetical protein